MGVNARFRKHCRPEAANAVGNVTKVLFKRHRPLYAGDPIFFFFLQMGHPDRAVSRDRVMTKLGMKNYVNGSTPLNGSSMECEGSVNQRGPESVM